MDQRNSRPKTSTKQIQFHIAAVYDEISAMVKERPDLQINLPTEVSTAVERVNLIKSTIQYLLETKQNEQGMPNTRQKQQDSSSIFTCADCQTYEKNLQKLQGEVRNHIRTHQQLRLYQDGLEQKIQEMKKEKKETQRKMESMKKKYEEIKNVMNSNLEKVNKLEAENQKLKSYSKDQSKRLNRYESNKENLGQWKNQSQRERNSIEKRVGSSERMRVSVNVRSTKGIPISSKIMQEKTKQDKAKAIKNRIGFGF